LINFCRPQKTAEFNY